MTDEELSKWFSEKLEAAFMDAMMGGPRPKQRMTALRCTETVEVIEPLRCICGHTIVHLSNCPMAYYGA